MRRAPNKSSLQVAEPDLDSLFRDRLQRLCDWLDRSFEHDLELVLIAPTTGPEETERWVSQIRAEREGRPHILPYHAVEYAAPNPSATSGVTAPVTVGEGLAAVRAGVACLCELLVTQVRAAVLTLSPELAPAVLARTHILVDRWPLPRFDQSPAALALHALMASCGHLPPGELPPEMLRGTTDTGEPWFFLRWPPETAPLEVVRWARHAFNRLAPGRGDELVIAVERQQTFVDWFLQAGGTRLTLPPAALALVFLAEKDVREGLQRAAFALDASKTHHDMVAGWTKVPRDGTRARARARDLGTRRDAGDTITRVELLLPGASVQLQLPLPEFESMHDSAIIALRRLFGPEGLRHWAALLRLFSVEGGRTGVYRWSLDEHLQAMGYAEIERQRKEVQARAAEMVETLAKLELAIYTTGNTLRERRRLLLETGRFERREGSEWKLEGIEFMMNERVYGGVRQSTGEIGRDWMPAPAALAQINHARYQHAHGLGMLLAIRLRWRFEEGFDQLSLTGKNLLALAAIPYSDRRASRAWATLRKTLDALVTAGLLHDYGWKELDQAWTLAGVCHVRAAHWLTDRATRGLLPAEAPPIPDRPFTGAEFSAWRKARGWTQREAAERLGVSQVAVHKAETKPDGGLGHKLREAFRRFTEEGPVTTERSTGPLLPVETPSAQARSFTGAELLAWRKARGWTQREAAERLGVSHVAVHKAETKPDGGLGHKLRKAFQRVTEEDADITP